MSTGSTSPLGLGSIVLSQNLPDGVLQAGMEVHPAHPREAGFAKGHTTGNYLDRSLLQSVVDDRLLDVIEHVIKNEN